MHIVIKKQNLKDNCNFKYVNKNVYLLCFKTSKNTKLKHFCVY